MDIKFILKLEKHLKDIINDLKLGVEIDLMPDELRSLANELEKKIEKGE